jgi:hypothetical protein
MEEFLIPSCGSVREPRGNASTGASDNPSGLQRRRLPLENCAIFVTARRAEEIARRFGCWRASPLRRPLGLSSADVPHRLLARLLATAASLSANAAVLVLTRVALALLSAPPAGGRADLKHLA